MKKAIIIAAALLLAVSSFAQNGKSIYTKYSDSEGISAVYISPAMFRMMGRVPSMEVNDTDVDLSRIIMDLKGMYILNSENPKTNAAIRSDVNKFISKGEYELIMEVKDNGETVRIYTVGDPKTVKGFVLLADERDECVFICIDGSMPREELTSLIANSLDD